MGGNRWWVALAVVGLGACESFIPGGDVRVRVENGSGLTFDRLVLYPGGVDSVVATSLVAGQRTPYQQVSTAYALVTVAASFGTESDRMQVIDHVGDPTLGGGKYTYVIGLVADGGRQRLTQQLRRD
ncbi:MAG: hypothetical protein ACKVZ0_14690 [Gemmatimonadales bacterium]